RDRWGDDQASRPGTRETAAAPKASPYAKLLRQSCTDKEAIDNGSQENGGEWFPVRGRQPTAPGHQFLSQCGRGRWAETRPLQTTSSAARESACPRIHRRRPH